MITFDTKEEYAKDLMEFLQYIETMQKINPNLKKTDNNNSNYKFMDIL